MAQTRILTVGIEALAAVVCCVTPVLIISLSAVGRSAWTGYLDYVPLPAIAIFVALIIYAVIGRKTA